MDREIVLRPKINLSSYRKTIEKYLPSVLVKCTKYTNSKRLAEIIALYVFICSYQLAKILDGVNTMVIIIDNLVGVVGENLAKRTGTAANGQLLFRWEDDFHYAQRLAEMEMEKCYKELQKTQILQPDVSTGTSLNR